MVRARPLLCSLVRYRSLPHVPSFVTRFDSLTGVPSTQKTIAFEKASVLFNIAALYTQIAARQVRATGSAHNPVSYCNIARILDIEDLFEYFS